MQRQNLITEHNINTMTEITPFSIWLSVSYRQQRFSTKQRQVSSCGQPYQCMSVYGSSIETSYIFSDFAKAFETVIHRKLLSNLEYYGIRVLPLSFIKILSNRQNSKSQNFKIYLKPTNHNIWSTTGECPRALATSPIYKRYLSIITNCDVSSLCW